MRFELDISDVIELERRAKDELATIPRVMKSILDVAALEERSSHEYNNQSGDLQRSTRARIDQSGRDETVVELEMAEDYASYVVKAGLSNIEEEAKLAENGIEIVLNAMADRIAR